MQYGDSLYKIDFVEEPWSVTAVKMIDIDLTKFGEQTVTSDGVKVLVTPSTAEYIVHDDYEGPSTYYKYNETSRICDIPFTGYRAYDEDRDRYYDASGNFVPVAHYEADYDPNDTK